MRQQLVGCVSEKTFSVEVDEDSSMVRGGSEVERFITDGFDRIKKIGSKKNVVDAFCASDMCVWFGRLGKA